MHPHVNDIIALIHTDDSLKIIFKGDIPPVVVTDPYIIINAPDPNNNWYKTVSLFLSRLISGLFDNIDEFLNYPLSPRDPSYIYMVNIGPMILHLYYEYDSNGNRQYSFDDWVIGNFGNIYLQIFFDGHFTVESGLLR